MQSFSLAAKEVVGEVRGATQQLLWERAGCQLLSLLWAPPTDGRAERGRKHRSEVWRRRRPKMRPESALQRARSWAKIGCRIDLGPQKGWLLRINQHRGHRSSPPSLSLAWLSSGRGFGAPSSDCGAVVPSHLVGSRHHEDPLYRWPPARTQISSGHVGSKHRAVLVVRLAECSGFHVCCCLLVVCSGVVCVAC